MTDMQTCTDAKNLKVKWINAILIFKHKDGMIKGDLQKDEGIFPTSKSCFLTFAYVHRLESLGRRAGLA